MVITKTTIIPVGTIAALYEARRIAVLHHGDYYETLHVQVSLLNAVNHLLFQN